MKNTIILKLVLICSFCMCIITVFAQYDDYLLKNYVNPNYKRQSLDFNVGGYLNNSSYEQKTEQGINNSSDIHDYFNTSGNAEANYKRVKNSVATQNETNVSLLMDGRFYKEKREKDLGQNILNRGGSHHFELSFSNQGYHYRNSQKFILLTPSVNISTSNQKYKFDDRSEDSNKDKRNYFSANTSFRLGLGKGRIEEVGDARQAVYILQDLQKQGVLKKELSEEEINELARLITKEKYTRQFDSRIRLIREITAIDSFMVVKGYVNNDHSAEYFTSLYDNWQFANVYRKSGNRFTLGVMPSYRYLDQKNKTVYFNNNGFTEQNTLKYRIMGMDLFTGFESEKPINLYWQRTTSIELSSGWQEYKTEVDKTDMYHTMLIANYGIAYYPNSRTSIGGNISEGLVYDSNDNYSAISSMAAINFNMSYYFSPQFRLNLDYRVVHNYSYRDNKDSNMGNFISKHRYPRNDLSVSLTYSLF